MNKKAVELIDDMKRDLLEYYLENGYVSGSTVADFNAMLDKIKSEIDQLNPISVHTNDYGNGTLIEVHMEDGRWVTLANVDGDGFPEENNYSASLYDADGEHLEGLAHRFETHGFKE